MAYWSPMGEKGKYGTYAISTVDTPNYGKVAVYRSSGDNSGFRDQWFPFEGIDNGWFVKPNAPARWMLCTYAEADHDGSDDARFWKRMGCNEEMIDVISQWENLPDEQQYGELIDDSEYPEPWLGKWQERRRLNDSETEKVRAKQRRNERRSKDMLMRLEHERTKINRSPSRSIEEYANKMELLSDIHDEMESVKNRRDPLIYDELALLDEADRIQKYWEDNSVDGFTKALTLMGWERDPATVKWLEKRRQKL